MHDALRSFRRLSEEDYATLWKDGLFVVDTNVLLNLYRYPTHARDNLIGVFEQLGDRLFAPFHVALEFERNRVGIIAEQKKRFREVREVVITHEKTLRDRLEAMRLGKRHPSIEADTFLDRIAAASATFLRDLEEREKTQPDVNDPDELRDRIAKLFEGRVGEPPASQKELDDLYEIGERRYARGMPPGYRDTAKGKTADEYEFGGLVYRRQFGDLTIWTQIITAAASGKHQHVVFVTDDEKEDWLSIAESGGKKLGPRPELVDEIRRRAGVNLFHIYNSEQLYKWSGKHLKVKVQQESADQIRDTREAQVAETPPYYFVGRSIESAVTRWASNDHPAAAVHFPAIFPDVEIRTSDQRSIGYEVRAITEPTSTNILRSVRDFARAVPRTLQLDELWLVLVNLSPVGPTPADTSDRVAEILTEELYWFAGDTTAVFGEIVYGRSAEGIFVPTTILGSTISP